MGKLLIRLNLIFKKVFVWYFHPPGYSVAAQARKSEHEESYRISVNSFRGNYVEIFI